MCRYFFSTLLLSVLYTVSVSAQLPVRGEGRGDASPFCFWYWMYGAVSKEGIHADLQAMKDAGLRGTYLMPIRGVDEKPEYQGHAQQLTPAFWDMVAYAMQQCDSLGLELGVHICDGFALAGGPWFTPEESMQKVVWTETSIVLPPLRKKVKTANISLPSSTAVGYKDIAVYAVPVADTTTVIKPVAMTHSDNVTSDEKFLISCNTDCWTTFDFGASVAVRNVEVVPSGTNFQCQRMSVAASNDGIHFEPLQDFTPARQGWQNYLYNMTYTLPYRTDAQGKEKTYRYYRFSWTPRGTEPGSEDLDAAKWKPNLRLKQLIFRHDPRIHQWEGKTGLAWRVASESTASDIPASLCVPKDKLISLTVNADGTIDITPLLQQRGTDATAYRILRIGHASTGMTNATAGGGKGLECDKFSKAAVNKLIDNWFCRFASLPAERGMKTSPLKYFHVDSWECGCQNWSTALASEFKARRGYDLLPWLPVMVGIPVESASETERVLRDVRETINDLINDNFFATVRDRAHQMGMEFSSEAIAPTMVSDGLDHYRYSDLPMGEYWLNSPTHDKPNDMLDAISGAHIYGRNIVQAEGFTEVRGVWDEDPASIKTLLDRNFALGMNRLFFHVNTHNPWMDRKPGMTLDGIGLFFQRDQIWFPEVRPFVDYVTRCSSLLQMGRPVQDIAVYSGDEMPRRSVLPERLVSILPGLFGPERVAAEQKRLANEGQPMAESPVKVFHSAGIVDTKDWVNCLRGYQYDTVNPDVLQNHTTARDGRMCLDGGAQYRVLVVPGSRLMNPDAIISDASKAKIEALRKAGVIIIDKPYTAEDFSQYGLQRDIDVPVDIAYTHRTTAEGEIYFLSNQAYEGRDIEVSFRRPVHAKAKETPYRYDAVTNTFKPLDSELVDGRICLSVCIAPNGSCFILFPVSDTPDAIFASLPEQPKPEVVQNYDCDSRILLSDFTLQPVEMSMDPVAVHVKGYEGGPLLAEEQWNGVEQMKYFSGHANYTTTLKMKKVRGNEVITLDNVCNIGHVFVNDIDCGITWTAPYTLPIGHALKKGNNTIRIEVVNTWANALRGMDEGKAPYPGIWTNAKYRMKEPYLLPAGLLQPAEVW